MPTLAENRAQVGRRAAPFSPATLWSEDALYLSVFARTLRRSFAVALPYTPRAVLKDADQQTAGVRACVRACVWTVHVRHLLIRLESFTT